MGDPLRDIIAKCMAVAPMESDEDRIKREAWEAGADERRRREDERIKRERRGARLRDSGICLAAEDFPAVVADALELTPAVEHMRRWLHAIDNHGKDKSIEAPRRVLVLCGGVGIGKTVAAALAVAEWGGYCVRAPQLAQRLDPWRSDADAGHDLVPLGTYLIILDDLGTERDPREPRFAEALGRFCDERQAHGYTVITSNLRRSQFRERYDERVIDRLNQCAKAVELAGKSLRRNGGGL